MPKVYYVDFIVHPIPPSNTLAPIPFQVNMSSWSSRRLHRYIFSSMKFHRASSTQIAQALSAWLFLELMGWLKPKISAGCTGIGVFNFPGLTIQCGAKATAHGGERSKDLDASKILQRVWRVAYQKEANDFWLQVVWVACCQHVRVLVFFLCCQDFQNKFGTAGFSY